MQDKSSYNSPNKPQISEGLQNFINAMVEEIVLKGEAFDEQKKKWMKKYSEAEGVNYEELEGNLSDLLETFADYQISGMNSLLKLLEIQGEICNIDANIIKKIQAKNNDSKLNNKSMNREITKEYNDLSNEIKTLKIVVDELKKENLILKDQINGIGKGLKSLREKFNLSQQ
jgi:hypothetical protein